LLKGKFINTLLASIHYNGELSKSLSRAREAEERMFAEEHAGNASRKRAEQNRARRQKLKQQQEKKAPPKPSTNDQAGSTDAEATTATSPPSAVSTVPAAAATGVTAPKPVATTNKLSAVEKAEQQRKMRADTAALKKAAVRVQSVYRAYHSNQQIRKEQTELLSQRLQDVSTLRTLLQQKTKSDYVPPPATSTVLIQKLLFVTKRIPVFGRPRSIRIQSLTAFPLLQQVLDFAVLPGIQSKDDSLNPCEVWMQSSHGRYRFKELMRLVLVSVTHSGISDAASQSTIRFLRVVLGLDEAAESAPSRQTLIQYARSLLLSGIPVDVNALPSVNAPPPFRSKEATPSYALPGASLDLVAALRHYLLFIVAGPDPIPNNAEALREGCVPLRARSQAGALLRVVLQAVLSTPIDAERRMLQSRLVKEILTVPLLTWKVSAESLSDWVQTSKTSSASHLPLVTLLQTFADENPLSMAAGDIATLLPSTDLPLTLCAATTTQCLLANLVQLGRICPSISGVNVSQVDYTCAAIYFDFVTVLLDVVPLGTFSSRDSVVEWITDGKGHHKPVVLSPVIIDQCKLLLVDSFVRRLFNCAIDTDALETEKVLASKNDKDKKHEKDLLEEGSSSAATLAAKEARMDRNRSFWNSSKWARKLSKGVAGLISGDGGKEGKTASKKSNGGEGLLMNTSSVSRKLAGGTHDRSSTSAVLDKSDGKSSGAFNNREYSSDLLFALCRTFSIILARWGGGGKDDVVRRVSGSHSNGEKEIATSKPEPCVLLLLNVLCFSTPIVKVTWAIIQSDDATVSDLYTIIDSDKGDTPVRRLKVSPSFSLPGKSGRRAKHDGATLLYMFTRILSHSLIITDDIEIHDMDRPLPIHQLRRCIQVLKKLLYRACAVDDRSSSAKSNYFGLALISASSRTMRDLYDRSSRRPLCIPKLWLVPDLLAKELSRCKTCADYVSLLESPVLRVCPFLVSFKRRLLLFERIITTNRIDIQGENSQNPFNTNPLKPGIPVRITRGRILEDGLATMNNLGSNMRRRIAVQYVNEAGTRESGIDAGGLFKEFWTDLSAVAFNQNYALFQVTDGAGNCLYPNPSSGAAHGSEHVVLFAFLGRILGKALYEGITINPRFAHFFLSFLRGDYNYLHMLSDLSTVDPQLYNNLMFLKTYDGDAEDLALSFTVTVDDFGGTREIPLVPNGANIDVTNTNKQRYIELVAKYYVVDRVREQSEAVTRGLWEVIDRSWLRLFNEPELQVLISGASDGKIDVEDMRAHTRYVGGYSGLDRNVNRFWSVVASLDSKQQASLLRFVTSCERPPPLGFGSMQPPFTIQRVGILRDGDKLPSSSTCFNVLKLPTYSSEKVLRQRLIYAIESGAGFELS
jgi:ubiquitin-protein ligase E3 C